jgi:hypothetical protein
VNRHMHCHTPRSQIIDSKHAADDISTQIIKHQDFPYGIPIWRQDGCRGYGEPCGRRLVVVVLGLFRIAVQVQHALNGPCDAHQLGNSRELLAIMEY